MRLSHRMIALILSSAALASSLAITGCAPDTTVYDPYWQDYHRWNGEETRLYLQWEYGSDRAHVDFPNRTPGDQLAYWSWRHS
jgi:hypothetical protein